MSLIFHQLQWEYQGRYGSDVALHYGMLAKESWQNSCQHRGPMGHPVSSGVWQGEISTLVLSGQRKGDNSPQVG